MDGRRGGGRPGLPSLPSGWYLDDLVHRAQFLEVGPLTDGSNMTHRMFDFVSGDPGQLLAYKELGVGPGTTARVQRARRGTRDNCSRTKSSAWRHGGPQTSSRAFTRDAALTPPGSASPVAVVVVAVPTGLVKVMDSRFRRRRASEMPIGGLRHWGSGNSDSVQNELLDSRRQRYNRS